MKAGSKKEVCTSPVLHTTAKCLKSSSFRISFLRSFAFCYGGSTSSRSIWEKVTTGGLTNYCSTLQTPSLKNPSAGAYQAASLYHCWNNNVAFSGSLRTASTSVQAFDLPDVCRGNLWIFLQRYRLPDSTLGFSVWKIHRLKQKGIDGQTVSKEVIYLTKVVPEETSHCRKQKS